MPRLTIDLPEPAHRWLEDQTRAQGYADADAYVRALIDRDRAQGDAVREVQALIDEALASGPPAPFDLDDFLARKRDEAPRARRGDL